MTKAIPAPNWERYASSRVETIRTCCLLLLGYAPKAAKAAGVTEYPTRSKRALAYNKLLARSCKEMLAGNPLLAPLEGAATTNRADFQKLPVSLLYFTELARSTASPYKGLLPGAIPEEFLRLRPRPVVKARPPEELLHLLSSSSPSAPAPTKTEIAEAVKKMPLAQQEAWATCGAILDCLTAEMLRNPAVFGKKNMGWLAGFHANEGLISEKVANWWKAQVHPSEVENVPAGRTIRAYLATARAAFEERRK